MAHNRGAPPAVFNRRAATERAMPFIAATALWAGLLCWGLDWWLPNYRTAAVDATVDDGRAAARGADLARRGADAYPPLLFLTQEVAFKCARLAFTRDQLALPSLEMAGAFLLIGRAVTSAHALLLMLLVTWLAGREAGALAAVLAALLVAANPTVGYYARTTNVDLPALLWWVGALAAYRAALDRPGTWAPPLLFGCLAALAITTKDQAAPLFLVPAAHLALTYGGAGRPTIRRIVRGVVARRWLLMVGGGVATFAAVYAAAGGYGRLARHLTHVFSHSAAYFEFPLTPAGLARFAWALLSGLEATLTWPGLAVGAASLVWLIRSHRLGRWMGGVGLSLVVYAVFMAVAARRVNPRFLLPFVIYGALVGGRGLAALVRWPRVAGPIRWGTAGAVLAANVVLGVGLALALKDNSRTQCRRWFEATDFGLAPGRRLSIVSFSASVGVRATLAADGTWQETRSVRDWSLSTVGVLLADQEVRGILPTATALYHLQPDVVLLLSSDVRDSIDGRAARRGELVVRAGDSGTRPWLGRLLDPDAPFGLAATFRPAFAGRFQYLFDDPTVWVFLRQRPAAASRGFLLREAADEIAADADGDLLPNSLDSLGRPALGTLETGRRLADLMDAAAGCRTGPMPVPHALALIDVAALQALAGNRALAARCLGLAAACPHPAAQEGVARVRADLGL